MNEHIQEVAGDGEDTGSYWLTCLECGGSTRPYAAQGFFEPEPEDIEHEDDCPLTVEEMVGNG